MFEAFIIYLYTALNTASIMSTFALLVGGLIFGFMYFLYSDFAGDNWGNKPTTKDIKKQILAKVPKKLVIAMICFVIFVPGKDDLKFIIGGSLVWNGVSKASNIKGIDKIPENLVGAMNYFLEEVQGKK